MIDTGLIAEGLRSRGHVLGHINKVPANAGDWEFEVDGQLLTLDAVRLLMETDDTRTTETERERGPFVGVPQEIE
jgi:hypothetical protein